jgi:BirA family biotin operon repressor/biotin-[acetyl-CoA-carboxylase] ligase
MKPKIYRFAEVESTNDVARELAEKEEWVNTTAIVVIADRQSKGRGREGREWFSPPSAISLSIVFKPKPTMEVKEAPNISLLAGLAVARCIREYGIDARVKLPNDVLVNGRKISGILIEAKTTSSLTLDYVIVGVGVNLNINQDEFPDHLKASSTSLKIELGEEVDKAKFIDVLRDKIQYILHLLSCQSGHYSF